MPESAVEASAEETFVALWVSVAFARVDTFDGIVEVEAGVEVEVGVEVESGSRKTGRR